MEIKCCFILMSILTVLLMSCWGQEEESSSTPPGRKVKMERIPADAELLLPEVSETVEKRLGKIRIGQNTNGRRLRRRKATNNETNTDTNNIIEVDSSRTIVKSRNHAQSEKDHEESRDEKDHENDHENDDTDSSSPSLNPVENINPKLLLQELKGLRKNIDQEIEKLESKNKSNVQKSMENKRADILIRTTRNLVDKAELAIRKKRQSDDDESENEKLIPYRACIYIDVPGLHDQNEGEPLLPENLKIIQKQLEIKESTAQLQKEETVQIDNSDDASVDNIVWLHLPNNNDSLDTVDMRTKLYNTVDNMHHDGKDVLFIPISKTYSDTDEVKHGFLKSLQINPERYNKFKTLKIKRM